MLIKNTFITIVHTYTHRMQYRVHIIYSIMSYLQESLEALDSPTEPKIIDYKDYTIFK